MDSKQALIIYRRIIMLSMVLTGLLLPVIGYVADKTPSRILVPLAFFTRCFACFLFVSIQEPNTLASYVACSLLILATTVENLSMEVLFMKNMPGEVRGTMNGILHFFGCAGVMIFTQAGGYLFDNVGPSAPFALVGTCDGLLGLAVTVLALNGYLKQ